MPIENQPLKTFLKLHNAEKMQTRRPVRSEERNSVPFSRISCKTRVQPLRLPPKGWPLTKPKMLQTHLFQVLELVLDSARPREKRKRFPTVISSNSANFDFLYVNSYFLLYVNVTLAHSCDVGEEMHVDRDVTVAAAQRTAPSFALEAE